MMQFRKHKSTARLPLTSLSSSKRSSGEPKCHGSNRTFVIAMLTVLGIITLVSLALSSSRRLAPQSSSPDPTVTTSRDRKLSPFYTEFPSLREPLETYEIVGLYFAASWCPMSTSVTELLDDTFRATLTTSSSDENNTKFTIVYISSDHSQREFDQYRKPGWRFVDFANEKERSGIKRHLNTCARREMEKLGIRRRDAEIPHLTILRNGSILTRTGIQDVKQRGTTAISYWSTSEPHHLNVSFQ